MIFSTVTCSSRHLLVPPLVPIPGKAEREERPQVFAGLTSSSSPLPGSRDSPQPEEGPNLTAARILGGC